MFRQNQEGVAYEYMEFLLEVSGTVKLQNFGHMDVPVEYQQIREPLPFGR